MEHCATLLWSIVVEHCCAALLWSIVVEHCAALLWSIVVENFCAALLCSIVMEHCCGALCSIVMEHCCGALLQLNKYGERKLSECDCPPQILIVLAWDLTPVSAVTDGLSWHGPQFHINYSHQYQSLLPYCRLPPRCKLDILSSGMLHGVE
jgi:hypothetical protein